jgi:hypothetical protein
MRCDVSSEADGQAVVAKAVSMGKLMGLVSAAQAWTRREKRERDMVGLLGQGLQIHRTAAIVGADAQTGMTTGR